MHSTHTPLQSMLQSRGYCTDWWGKKVQYNYYTKKIVDSHHCSFHSDLSLLKMNITDSNEICGSSY